MPKIIDQNNPSIQKFEWPSECDNNPDIEAKNLTAFLNEGWQLLEFANFLARGANQEGGGYLVKMYHPARQLSKECTIPRNQEIESLFSHQAVPGLHI